MGDGHRRVAGPALQGEHVGEGIGDAQVARTGDESGLGSFDFADHLGLVGDRLGDEDEGDAALFREGHAHFLPGDGLHDGGDHGDVHGQGGFLTAAELDQRGFQGHIRRDALCGGVARHQQVFAEGVGGFREVVGHRGFLLVKI